jgi:hypothetical protein
VGYNPPFLKPDYWHWDYGQKFPPKNGIFPARNLIFTKNSSLVSGLTFKLDRFFFQGATCINNLMLYSVSLFAKVT